MESVGKSTLQTMHGGVTALSRFIAQPSNRLGNTFKRAVDVAGAALGQATTIAGIDPDYQQLLEKQMQLQRDMMHVSMVSNIEKTRHETKMAGVRNMRVS